MREDFITLALSIKQQLEERFDKESLKSFYVYEALPMLMKEWEKPELTSDDTDIGIAGMKTFDSGSAADNRIRSDISRLARLYEWRRKDELFPARKGPK